MHPPTYARFVPTPCQDAPDHGRIILRDGSTAHLRRATQEDRPELERFFADLSLEARYKRFLCTTLPAGDQLARLIGCDPRAAVTLLVIRTEAGQPRVVATGSYTACTASVAEVALAVADAHHNNGLGTVLLERLARVAARNGFTHFWALTSADNEPMLDVFRRAGFALRLRPEKGATEIDLTLEPTETGVELQDARDRTATIASLVPLFRPCAVAVVGASRDPTAIGHQILTGLVRAGFAGAVYPVNPNATEVAGLRAWASVRELPGPVDLAVVAVPAPAVARVVDDCAARGVRALVVVSAGFAEAGGSGLQKALVKQVRGYGMRLVGPNCLGLLNTDPAVRLNASFAPTVPPPGRVALSSQSGAVGLAVLTAAARSGIGISSFVSVGNKADVSGNDLLQYWDADPGTDVILFYFESFGNPGRFTRIARRVGRRKPVVALLGGASRAGGRAAGSHTAALATNAAAAEALFRQSGVVRAGSLEELVQLAAAFGTQPPPGGPRVAIITNAGGPAILSTDACEARGLTVPEPSPQFQQQLRALLPSAASVKNPIDLVAAAGPEPYRRAIEAVLTSAEFDALIVIHTPVGLARVSDIERAITGAVATARGAGGTNKPVLACVPGSDEPRGHLECGSERIPCYSYPEAPAHVLGKMAAYAAWRERPAGLFPCFADTDLGAARRTCIEALAARGDGWLTAEEVRAVLTAAGLSLVPGEFVRTAPDAARAAARLGLPVALKLASLRFPHKSEVGGVKLNLTDEASVARAFDEIRDAAARTGGSDTMDGALVQPMVRDGVEVLVGVTRDPLFGPVVAFGLGGVHVEVLGDICVRVAPLTDRDASEMVRGIRGTKLLAGYRAHPPADLEAIEDTILRLSRLAEDVPEIGDIDLNPVFAFAPGRGTQIADARIHVRIASEHGIV